MAALWVWPLGAVSYVILTGSFDTDEIVAAVVLGGIGAAWHAAVLEVEARRFAFEGAAFGAIGRALAGLPGATLRVGARLLAALLHGEAGRQVHVPFDVGAQGSATDRGRRALVTLATSLAPDSYVLRIPGGEGEILCHALTGRTPGGDRRWPA